MHTVCEKIKSHAKYFIILEKYILPNAKYIIINKFILDFRYAVQGAVEAATIRCREIANDSDDSKKK